MLSGYYVLCKIVFLMNKSPTCEKSSFSLPLFLSFFRVDKYKWTVKPICHKI